ncbi:MAG: hypothetical protein MAG795_01178 [Candidatus Woesearchaeota archaeon]|nr:hypothetical protein [Candidatus Woesearchaeota archaeon]
MKNKEVKVKCFKCGNKYLTSQMRYDPTNPKNIVCMSCLDRKSQPSKKQKQEKKPENIRYYCVKCNFKFLRKKSQKITSCPYCGKQGTLTTKTDANSLLKTAGQEFKP